MVVPYVDFHPKLSLPPSVILKRRGVGTDISVKMAIATSMATIVFTSVSSVRAHHQRGAVRWDIVKSLAPGILLGGALAMSSTAIMVKLMAERLELESEHGRRVMGVLLFQDLAVVPLLVLCANLQCRPSQKHTSRPFP